MSFQEKVDAYSKRRKHINDLRAELDLREREHSYHTKRDFGLADGDVLDLGVLIELMSDVAVAVQK